MHMLKYVDDSRSDWYVRVRVARKCEVPSFYNQSETYNVSLLLIDREGTRMHALIKKNLIKLFTDKIHENKVYNMKNFSVDENKMKYKVPPHRFLLNFMRTTHVAEVEDESFPNLLYVFRPFPDILSRENIDDATLIDVIGEVVEKDTTRMQPKSVDASKSIDFVLEDLEKIRVPCTLWGDYADLIFKVLETVQNEPVIVLMQMCRLRNYSGVGLTNAYYVTKVMVNSPIPEIEKFRNKLLSGRECSSQRISQISSSSVYSVSDELESGITELKTIRQLLECTEVGYYYVVANIVAIVTEKDWWYLSCKKCSRKVQKQGRRFYCDKCKKLDTPVNTKFMLRVKLVDGTKSAVFMLWDREVFQLIGKTVRDIRERVAREDACENEIPDEIEDLVGKKAIFRIQVKDSNINGQDNVFTVVKLSNDPKLVEKYQINESIEKNLVSEFDNEAEKTAVSATKEVLSDDEVSTPVKTLSKRGSDESVEDVIEVDGNVGALSTKMSSNKFRRIVKEESP